MTTEVTQGMYESLMGTIWQDGQSTFYGVGTDYPVYYVSWHMAADFANELTNYVNTQNGTSLSNCYTCTDSGTTSASCTEAMDPNSCDGYSLPTETEWELAARSGTSSEFWTGEGSDLGGNYSSNSCNTSVTIQDGVSNPALSDYAWFCGNSNSSTQEVATKLPNAFGMYDIHGNLREWVADRWGCSYPLSNDSWCNISSTMRVERGGFWNESPSKIMASYRRDGTANNPSSNLTLRLRILSP
jgi:formylglycine-generating enzyme required for sulfatase activity